MEVNGENGQNGLIFGNNVKNSLKMSYVKFQVIQTIITPKTALFGYKITIRCQNLSDTSKSGNPRTLPIQGRGQDFEQRGAD